MRDVQKILFKLGFYPKEAKIDEIDGKFGRHMLLLLMGSQNFLYIYQRSNFSYQIFLIIITTRISCWSKKSTN